MGNFYSMLFGRNQLSELLLAVIGLKPVDVERLRDVYVDGDTIVVYTRTGGGNREEWPNKAITESPLYVHDYDDEFDSTYASFVVSIPEGFMEDTHNLSNVFEHGIRKEFAKHLGKTLFRQPTEADIEQEKVDEEQRVLHNTNHMNANGHTFVPMDDEAMNRALDIAEANKGELRTFWGILPLQLNVHKNLKRFSSSLVRVHIEYEWKIDVEYWEHCKEKFGQSHPITISRIQESVDSHLEREKEGKNP